MQATSPCTVSADAGTASRLQAAATPQQTMVLPLASSTSLSNRAKHTRKKSIPIFPYAHHHIPIQRWPWHSACQCTPVHTHTNSQLYLKSYLAAQQPQLLIFLASRHISPSRPSHGPPTPAPCRQARQGPLHLSLLRITPNIGLFSFSLSSCLKRSSKVPPAPASGAPHRPLHGPPTRPPG